jgi:TonB-linked SusC/RagA family outer membrane protein
LRISHVLKIVKKPALLALSIVFAQVALAQEPQAAAAPKPESSRTTLGTSQSNVAPLARLVTLQLRNVTLGEALNEVNRQAELGLAYSARVVPVDRIVSLSATNMPVGLALEKLLAGTGVRAEVLEGGAVVLTRASEASEPRREDTGPLFGLVTDSITSKPLVGAIVTVKGTSLRGVTDSLGHYLVTAIPTGLHTVTARMIGFRQLDRVVVIVANEPNRLDFALPYTQSHLQEVIVTATGPRRRLELGNDITVINADSIVRTQPIRSVTDLLDGRVPGLIVQRTSGAPGDPARIRIRGVSSAMLSNDPIIVVDGIRTYSEQSTSRGGNLAGCGAQGSCRSDNYAAPSPLDYMDPNSIETIEVVKGPSAATLYGQDAANGVIVITTKKGHAGPARWSVSADEGTTQMEGRYPELYLSWGHIPNTNVVVTCPHVGQGQSYTLGSHPCVTDSLVTFQMLNDPALTVLGDGSRRATTIGVSGGSQALTYSIDGSFSNELGMIHLPNYEVQRYDSAMGQAPPDWMQHPQNASQWAAGSRIVAALGANANVSLSAQLSRVTQQHSSLEKNLGALMSTYLDRASGTYFDQNLTPSQEVLHNYYERATDKVTQFTNGASLNWQPRTWAVVNADAGLQVVQRDDEIFLPYASLSRQDSTGNLARGNGNTVMSTLSTNVRTQRAMPRGFTFTFGLGANYNGQSVADLSGQVAGLVFGSSSFNQAGHIASLAENRITQNTFGWYVEPAISHRRQWLSLGMRYDGATSFGSGLRLPRFPKLSYSYLVSDEPWFPAKNLFQVLRLRVAYGQAGRQPPPTAHLRLYSAGKEMWVDGQFVDGVQLQYLGNTQLRPERSREMEGGLDADMLNDRLSVGITGYHRTTFDMLLGAPLPPSVYGLGVVDMRNIGEVVGAGSNFTISAQPVRLDRVAWSTSFTLSQDRGHVVRLGAGVQPFYQVVTTGLDGNPDGGIRIAAGYPLTSRWIKPIIGYADANGDGVLEPNEVLLGDTAVYVGNTLPDYQASASSTLSLLRSALVITADLNYAAGGMQRNETAVLLAKFSRAWNDPRSTIDQQAAAYPTSEYPWMQTVNTLRLNSVGVTYNLPPLAARRIGAKSFGISLLSGNVALWTNYHGLDPNVNAFTTGNNVVDTGIIPMPRTYQLRANATY